MLFLLACSGLGLDPAGPRTDDTGTDATTGTDSSGTGTTTTDSAATDTTETGDSTGTTETGTTGSTGNGLVGGLVEFQLVQIACPDCLGYDTDLVVGATAGFHAPESAGWIDWLPAVGTCAVNPISTAPTSSFQDAGEWLYLTSGSRSVGLRQTGQIYVAEGLAESDYVRNAAYDLLVAENGADLDAFTEPDAFITPQAISTLTPVEMLYTNPRDAFAARVNRNSASFTWGPTGGDGTFLVILDVYSESGVFQDEIVCRGADSGSLTVPSSFLGSYASGSLLVIGMWRYVTGGFERPDNGSTVETVVTFGVLGTGVLLP